MKRIGTILVILLTVLAGLSRVVVAAPEDSKSIVSFVECLNTVGKAGSTTIADTVEPCIPKGCRVTVTMGPTSAQAACTLGTCQLPRVIFDCPGSADDLRFRPSYLLCPINSKGAGDEFGINRIEVGEDTEKFGNPLVVRKGDKLVPTTGKMKMADIPIPPGTAIATTVDQALSVVVPEDPADGQTDSKKCNACHIDKTSAHARQGDPALSAPIDAFGLTRLTRGIHGADYVIDISANVHKKLIEDAKKNLPRKPGGDGTPVTNQRLDQICDCINNNQIAIANQADGMDLPDGSPGVPEASRNPNVDPILLLNLCRALAKKI